MMTDRCRCGWEEGKTSDRLEEDHSGLCDSFEFSTTWPSTPGPRIPQFNSQLDSVQKRSDSKVEANNPRLRSVLQRAITVCWCEGGGAGNASCISNSGASKSGRFYVELQNRKRNNPEWDPTRGSCNYCRWQKLDWRKCNGILLFTKDGITYWSLTAMSDPLGTASVTENKTYFRCRMATAFPPLENRLTHLIIGSMTRIEIASCQSVLTGEKAVRCVFIAISGSWKYCCWHCWKLFYHILAVSQHMSLIFYPVTWCCNDMYC